jgi:hypothetical protein
MSKCASSGGVVTNAPGCLSHQHQRTWVAVLGAATSGAPAAASAVMGLPNTAAAPGFSMVPLAIALIAAGVGARSVRRKRRKARS